jgi:hypothetical protein
VDLHCLFHTALHIVFAGIATVEDVDRKRSSRDLGGHRGGEGSGGREVGKEKKERERRGVKAERSVKHGDEGGRKEGMREVVRKREIRGTRKGK